MLIFSTNYPVADAYYNKNGLINQYQKKKIIKLIINGLKHALFICFVIMNCKNIYNINYAIFHLF